MLIQTWLCCSVDVRFYRFHDFLRKITILGSTGKLGKIFKINLGQYLKLKIDYKDCLNVGSPTIAYVVVLVSYKAQLPP